jgi:hypothetical protein
MQRAPAARVIHLHRRHPWRLAHTSKVAAGQLSRNKVLQNSALSKRQILCDLFQEVTFASFKNFQQENESAGTRA